MNTQDLNAQSKIIRREGKILDRFDAEHKEGFRTHIWVEYQGWDHLIRMVNGEVMSIRKVVESI